MNATTANPTVRVAAACTQALAEFGVGVVLLQGPLKKEKRIFEKARACNFDGIHDYGRLYVAMDWALVRQHIAVTNLLGTKLDLRVDSLDET